MMTVTRFTKRSADCAPETLIAIGTLAPLSGRVGTSNWKTPGGVLLDGPVGEQLRPPLLPLLGVELRLRPRTGRDDERHGRGHHAEDHPSARLRHPSASPLGRRRDRAPVSRPRSTRLPPGFADCLARPRSLSSCRASPARDGESDPVAGASGPGYPRRSHEAGPLRPSRRREAGPRRCRRRRCATSSRVVRDITPGDAHARRAAAGSARLKVARLPVVKGRPRLGCPLAGIGKMVCIGLNYTDHAEEVEAPAARRSPPSSSRRRARSPARAIRSCGRAARPSSTTRWSSAAVIGREARYVDEARALAHVAGYCIVNDVSERAFQMEHGGTTTKGKSAGHVRPGRTVARDRRRDPGSPGASGSGPTVNGERRPGRQHPAHGLPGARARRLREPLHVAPARRPHLHRHARRRGARRRSRRATSSPATSSRWASTVWASSAHVVVESKPARATLTRPRFALAVLGGFRRRPPSTPAGNVGRIAGLRSASPPERSPSARAPRRPRWRSTVQMGCSARMTSPGWGTSRMPLIEPRRRVGGRHGPWRRRRSAFPRRRPAPADRAGSVAPAGREVEAEQRRAGRALHQLHGRAVPRVDLQHHGTALGAGRSRSRSGLRSPYSRVRASAMAPTSSRAAAPPRAA